MSHFNKAIFFRILFYLTGLLTLALGIIFNTKSGLGVSPIISVSYSISTIWNLNFGNTTFLLYVFFVFIEIFLHILGKRPHFILVTDLLQLPLSLVFTRFMNLFSSWIPAPQNRLPLQFLFLFIGITLTGIGAAMSVNMRIIPNPGDGIVQAVSDCIHKPMGFTKNCFDLFNICITISLGLLCTGKLIGIGIGTVLAVIGVGRVIALFNHLFQSKMNRLTGMK